MIDFNDAGPQMGPMGEPIPDGAFCKLKMTIRPGGSNGFSPVDNGLLRSSEKSDAKMLDCEFAVLEGPYANRKFWQMFTVQGGKTNKKGESIGWNISKAAFRAMIESATGVNPKDTSAEANAKRQLQGLAHLNGIIFAGKVMIEPSDNDQYDDQNRLAIVVTPDDQKHTAIMRGEDVPPEPVNAKTRKKGGQAQSSGTPSWDTGGAAAAAQTSAQPPASGGASAPAWLNG